MPKTSPAPSVDYKSPKQDIWKAYKELVTTIDSDVQPSPAVMAQTSKANTNLKQKLSQQIDQISSTLQSEIEELLKQLSQASEIIDQLTQSQKRLEDNLKQAEQEAKKTQQREAEEYNYEFSLRKQRQEDELKEFKLKTEAEIASKKAEIKTQQDELEELQTQVATFDAKLTQAVKSATDQISKELTTSFEHQKALADQKHTGAEQLYQQKIDSLEQVIKSQENEIKLLQSSLRETQAQLTRIAERAVEKTPLLPSPQTKKSEE